MPKTKEDGADRLAAASPNRENTERIVFLTLSLATLVSLR